MAAATTIMANTNKIKEGKNEKSKINLKKFDGTDGSVRRIQQSPFF